MFEGFFSIIINHVPWNGFHDIKNVIKNIEFRIDITRTRRDPKFSVTIFFLIEKDFF